MKKFKKLAFLSENNSEIIDDAVNDAATLALAGGLSAAGQSAARVGWNFTNSMSSQNSPIGELFADYAANKLKHPSGVISYLPQYPRAAPDQSLLSMLVYPNRSYIDSVPVGERIGPDDIQRISEDYIEQLGREIDGEVPPDKFRKFRHMGLSSLDDVFENVGVDKIKHHVVVPRNNMQSLAHEFGHIAGFNEVEPVEGQPIRNMLKSIGRKGWSAIAESAGAAMPEIPVAKDIHAAAVNTIRKSIKNPIISDAIISLLFSAPLPALATGLAAASPNVRSAIKYVSPSETVDDAVDWIGENPGTSVSLATLPFLIHEGFTTAPGGKLTYDFFKDLPNKAGVLANHPYTDDVLKAVGKVSPNKEVLKFLGHNAMTLAGAAALPLGLIAANYLMNRNKES